MPLNVHRQRKERIDELRRTISELRSVIYNRPYPIATPSEMAEIGSMEFELLRLELAALSRARSGRG